VRVDVLARRVAARELSLRRAGFCRHASACRCCAAWCSPDARLAAPVSTLASQLRTAIAALPGKAGAAATRHVRSRTLAPPATLLTSPPPAPRAAAPRSAPTLAVDLSAATCTLPGLSCVAPRGRFDVVLLRDTLVLCAKGAPALTVPFSAVEHVLVRAVAPRTCRAT
jgi:hypothetical protein